MKEEPIRAADKTSQSLQNLEKKLSKTQKQLQHAKNKIPKKRTLKTQRIFDDGKAKAKTQFSFESSEKHIKRASAVKQGANRLNSQSINYAHRKISEVEKENSSVEAAHKTERAIEDLTHRQGSHIARKRQGLHKKVHVLEQKAQRISGQHAYAKYLADNPDKGGTNGFNKWLQKQRNKRAYQKAYRSEKTGAAVTQRTVDIASKITKKLIESIAKNQGMVFTALIIGSLLMFVGVSISSCASLFTSSISTIMYSCWASDPMDIDLADLHFTQKEAELKAEIKNIETTHSGFDEYRYNIGNIGHDPIELISYLSAQYDVFTYDLIASELESLFEAMYQLTVTEITETRTRTREMTVYSIDPVTGEWTSIVTQVEEAYDYKILDVNLITTPLAEIIASRLSSEKLDICIGYVESKGGLQQLGSPFELDWYPYISSYYGYRIGPTSGVMEFHRGLDIALPEGTEIHATQTGTVETAAYDSGGYGNYVVITDTGGYTTKYAHMSVVNVTEGQEVTIGDVIGEVGTTGNSTGNHLHIEVLYNDGYYNPLFYLNVGDGSL